MSDIIKGLTDWFQSNSIPPELIIFFISLMPILELRGGLIAAALLGVKFSIAFPICFIGNILPIPIILKFFKRVIKWLSKLDNWVGRLSRALEHKVERKSKKLDAGKAIGLLLFVAIPLPGTGGWTGAMVASILDMRIKKSLPIIILGVVIAGIIMSLITYLVPGLFGF